MKVNAEVDTLLNKIVKDLEDAKAKDIQIINISCYRMIFRKEI